MATDNPLVTKEDAITGLTSNPSIFETAIAKTDEYDDSLASFVKDFPDASNIEIFNHLAIADIQSAADIFAEVYRASEGEDGMVSLEVAPDGCEGVRATNGAGR